jgi:uroporphyrinogen-III decarboxylase
MEGVKNWEKLTWQEKREERFKRWLNPPGVKFVSQAAEKLYRERAARFIKAIKLEEPDRVPCILPSGIFPPHYVGYTLRDIMYDYEKLKEAYLKFVADFDMDTCTGPSLVFPGRVLEMTDHRLHKWPGHGLPDDAPIYQYVEQEYMKADEYDVLLKNPADYWWRYLLPRVVGAFAPFSKLPPMGRMMLVPIGFYAAMADPEVETGFKTMIEAGEEVLKWQKAIDEVNRAFLAAGVPNLRGGAMAGAPFDNIADMLRGTRGMVMDMYRQPERLHEAMENIVPDTIRSAVAAADATNSPFCFMPLHKGDESFMSPKQFETFYWPTFRAVLMGLIEEGLVPYPFAEGRYGARLEVIKDLPRTSMLWSFEDIDMARAKKVLGGTACVAGNVPASVMHAGTPQEVKECCRKLIEACAPGGGYILTGAAGMNEGNPENLRAFMVAVREYGVYK